ncbi:MAG: hypothetical protein KBF88_06050 [Polyangiaceae bacterium]|nr:hypothetical protein [Polyangiaceae bacterium]
MSAEYTLFRCDAYEREKQERLATFPDLEAGLAALWSHVLSDGIEDDGSITIWDHSLRGPDGKDWFIPRAESNPILADLRKHRHESILYRSLVDAHVAMKDSFSLESLRDLLVVPERVWLEVKKICAFLEIPMQFRREERGWSAEQQGQKVFVENGEHISGGGYDSDITMFTIRVSGPSRKGKPIAWSVRLEDVALAGWYRYVECDDVDTKKAYEAAT